MNPTDPLANLRDIHLPEAISWWPMAPGWWFLLILISMGLLFSGSCLISRYQKRLYRRQAMEYLEKIENLQGQKQLVELMALLKRTAISAYPDQALAKLSPNELLEFLKTTCKEPIFQHIPNNLESELYANQIEIKPVIEDFLTSAKVWAKIWITKHPQRISRGHWPSC